MTFISFGALYCTSLILCVKHDFQTGSQILHLSKHSASDLCSGNGESEGEFEYGNYQNEVDDLRSVIVYLREVKKRSVKAIVGHSKGELPV
jgi:hypothetical protein